MSSDSSEHLIRRYRRWYARLLRCHSRRYHERFSKGMEQTFSDLLRERAAEEQGLFGYALGLFTETAAGILRENLVHLIMQHKNVIRIFVATALILAVPLVAMQFTDEVNWSLGDFVGMGILLLGTGFAYELATRKAGSTAHKLAVGIAVGAALLLLWINLAVGIIGSEDHPANMMYLGILAVGYLGAIFARFQPRGMARALYATAIAHGLVTAVTLFAGFTSGEALVKTSLLNVFFIGLWIVSAQLFRESDSVRNSAA